MGKNTPAAVAKPATPAQPKAPKSKEVIFYCFSVGNGLTGFSRLVNNYTITKAEAYTRPDGKQDFRNQVDMVFEGGIYKTSDEAIIAYLDEYIETHPHGDFKISREEPQIGSDTTPNTVTVEVEKKVIPFSVTTMIGLEQLKELLKKECDFESESNVFDDIVAEAVAAGHIQPE